MHYTALSMVAIIHTSGYFLLSYQNKCNNALKHKSCVLRSARKSIVLDIPTLPAAAPQRCFHDPGTRVSWHFTRRRGGTFFFGSSVELKHPISLRSIFGDLIRSHRNLLADPWNRRLSEFVFWGRPVSISMELGHSQRKVHLVLSPSTSSAYQYASWQRQQHFLSGLR